MTCTADCGFVYALRSGGRRVADGGICKQRPRVSPKAIQIPP